jgi:outer membrane protein assembly factor BamB
MATRGSRQQTAGSGQQSRGFDFLICAACCLLPAACCFADPPKLFGEIPRTAQRFADAAALEKQQRWADAIEVYLRLADEAGDDLVPADDDSHHLLTARTLIHRRIAARPELLAPYRSRVEPRAKRLLEQGESMRDPQLLEQVVDQFFCSRSADAALHLLGDMACEPGEFEQACRYWRMLEPATLPHGLGYPDPRGGPALARAKQVLARMLAGERAEASADLKDFRKRHSDAAGHLAGRDGNLAGILQSLLDAGDAVRVPVFVGVAPPPTTFAGDASRNGVLQGILPPFSPQPRYAAIPLPGAADDRLVQRPPVQPSALAFYPMIAHGQVFVADARSVLAYDIASGRLSGRYVKPGEPSEEKLRLPAGGSFTLTVDGDRLYCRLGSRRIPARGEASSVLVCLQWQPEQPALDDRLRTVWTLPAVKSDGDPATVWEGTPVVRDGRLFVAITRIDGTRAVSTIVCYPAADPSSGPIWRKDVYEAAAETADRTRLHLLTLAGPNVVLSSEAGVIVALEAATGRRAWAYRYPAVQRNGTAEPNPAVFARGTLFVAPTDSDRVWCLDAASGAAAWTSEPLQVAHLLGVADGRVICALGGFHAGLCALDAVTGRRLPDWGCRVAGADALAPFGRGLLCRDRVYWPTRAAGVNELRWDGTTGYPPTCFHDLPGGNLAYGDGCLVVATADRLHVLVGEPAAVMGPGHRVGQRPMSERHELLLWRADMLHQSRRPAAEVRAVFDSAAAAEYPAERRFLAMHRRAEFERLAGNHESAAAVARQVADADELSRVVVRDADGVIRSARTWASQLIGAPVPESRPTADEREPEQQPRLRLPLEPTWRLPLDSGHERGLLAEHDPEPGRVFVCGRPWLACRETRDGSERWRAELSFTPTWLTTVNGSLIVAGDNGVARLSAADGRPAWQFLAPAMAPWFDRPGWRDLDAVAPVERLAGFHWVGGRLVAQLGSRSLLSIDGVTGRIVWQQSAPMARQYHPAYFADGRCVVAQSSDGRRWVFDAAAGRILHTGPAPTDAWPTPPTALDERRLLVVEEGRLVALDRSTWKSDWTWDLPRPVSLTGELPRTRLTNGVLLVGVPRNDCYEVERLNPVTGQPRSAEGVAVGSGPIDLAAVAVDGDVLHVVAEGECKTIDCSKDSLVARRPLPPALRWRIEPTADGLLCWTVPVVSPTEILSRSGRLVQMCHGRPARVPALPGEMSVTQPDIELGPRGVVRVIGNEVWVVSDSEIRAYRGANREVK